MKLIKRLSADIACNIDEAREKIRTAYALKAECPEAAAWYREMAAAHINFNTNGHAVVKKLMSPPAREAWIEMGRRTSSRRTCSSRLPRGRRGLK